MGKKAGICWHFATVQNPTRLAVSTDTSFFAVFQANLLNENEILAIIIGKLQKIIRDLIKNSLSCVIFTRLLSDRYQLLRFVRNS